MCSLSISEGNTNKNYEIKREKANRLNAKFLKSKSETKLRRNAKIERIMPLKDIRQRVESLSSAKNPRTIKALPSPITKKKKEERAKITLFQAAIRGWNTRNEVFLTHQLMPAIQTHLVGYSPVKYKDISRVLCIELNQMSLNAKKYNEKSVRCSAASKAFDFKHPDKKKKKHLCRPFSLLLEMDARGQGFQVLIIPNKKYSPLGEMLGSGAYRDVYRAQSFDVPRRLENGARPISYKPYVLAKLQYPKDGCVEESLEIQEEILKTVKGKFVEMSTKSFPRASGKPNNTELKQPWYNGDLCKAMKSHSVPLDFTLQSQELPLTFKGILNIFVDVIKSLEGMHEKGFVHRDIKTPNIFLKVINNNIEGFVGDFDLTQKIGTSPVVEVYAYWDAFSSRGLVYPSTDNFSLVICLGEALVPGFLNQRISEKPGYLLEDFNFVHFKAAALTNHVMNSISSFKNPLDFDDLKTSLYDFYFNIELPHSKEYDYLQITITKKIAEFSNDNMHALSEGDLEQLRQVIKEVRVISKIVNKIREVFNKDDIIDKKLRAAPHLVNKYRELTNRYDQKFYEQIIFMEQTRNLRLFIENLQKCLA